MITEIKSPVYTTIVSRVPIKSDNDYNLFGDFSHIERVITRHGMGHEDYTKKFYLVVASNGKRAKEITEEEAKSCVFNSAPWESAPVPTTFGALPRFSTFTLPEFPEIGECVKSDESTAIYCGHSITPDTEVLYTGVTKFPLLVAERE